jgi:exosortase
MTAESNTGTLPDSQASPSPTRAVRLSGGLGSLATVVLVLLWGYAVYRLGTLWATSDDYAYGWFVPLLCLCLFWERWQHRPDREGVEAAAGPLILWALLGLALVPSCLFLEVIPYWRFAGWSFALAIIGITFCALYLIGGRSWVHHFAFPLLFFLIAVPWPSRIEGPLVIKLSHLNAALSTWVANWLGTPAIRQGVVIQTGVGMVGVDEACSGIRSFQAAVMVSLFLGELFRYGLFRRLFFLLSGVGLAFTCNVVRTTYLVRVCDLKGRPAVNTAHDPAGFTILGITLAGLLLLAWLFRPKRRSGSGALRAERTAKSESAAEAEVRTRWAAGEHAEPESPSAPTDTAATAPTRRPPKFALATALIASVVWILAVEIGIEAWFRPTESLAASGRRWALQLPTQQPGFRESAVREGVRSMLKCNEDKQADWREANGRPWQVYYLRWDPARTRYRAVEASWQARGHAPDVCLQLSGMTLQKNFGNRLQQINGTTFWSNMERFLDQDRPLHVMTCYWEPNPAALEDRPADPPGTKVALHNALRSLQIRDRGRNERCVLKVGVWGMETDAEAEKAFRDLLEQMVRT